ncbi:hypothetical protein WNY81_20565 [Shewanella frigidimarina]|uniref:hypothetical protein n=1 Tax=Shewanella frigidimarina TaxID=56812 RepID=UPI00316D8C09
MKTVEITIKKINQIAFNIDCFVSYFPEGYIGDLYLKKVAFMHLDGYWDILNGLSDYEFEQTLNKYKNFKRYSRVIELVLLRSLG